MCVRACVWEKEKVRESTNHHVTEFVGRKRGTPVLISPTVCSSGTAGFGTARNFTTHGLDVLVDRGEQLWLLALLQRLTKAMASRLAASSHSPPGAHRWNSPKSPRFSLSNH